MKDLSAVQNDLKRTEKQIETDLGGNPKQSLVIENAVFY